MNEAQDMLLQIEGDLRDALGEAAALSVHIHAAEHLQRLLLDALDECKSLAAEVA